MAPYVVVLQSHLLDAMPTVVVAPLLQDDERRIYAQTSAKVEFEGQAYSVSVAELAAVDIRGLGRSLGNLLEYEYAIRRALDAVLVGF
jgi:toxin CcdB